ncbi:MICAL-like protein 1 [Scomber scombrus]|uniref:MICAL-like protein 1 n=1 Tax=Scomber scombrus TaxID=13677 RepID=UPI002DDC8CE2|nr:MICAL-like protein 1 [Scomber scombrus]
MASPKALREWCRITCAKYPNVEIKNMSTSFRDGLAFCAIIHKHRPDLIDFNSLSKDNVYQNNKLAFEVAETKLGIPALLDPQDMVSTKVPDSLSVITYLFQYYYFFSRKSDAGLASLRSSHVTVLDNLTKIKAPDGLKLLKSSTNLSSGEDNSSSRRPHTVCHLCFKPVHLIQRHLIDGKVYHRSCFRCKVCHSALLPESYTQGRDAASLICSHHTPVDLHQCIGSTGNSPKCKFEAGYLSLSGLAITSVPHYPEKTQDRLIHRTVEAERREKAERSREVKDGKNRDSQVVLKSTVKPARPNPPPPGGKHETEDGAGKTGPASILADGKVQQEVTKTEEPSELSSACVQVTEGSSRPLAAPRHMSDSSSAPVPAPRTKTLQTTSTSSSPTAGNSSNHSKSSTISSHVTSSSSCSPVVKTNHPWMAIVHPGPWTQLPPAPAPIPSPRSKSVCDQQGLWYRPKLPPPNPFEEETDEDAHEEAEDQSKPSAAGGQSESCDNLANVSLNTDASVSSNDAENTADKSTPDDNVMDKVIPQKAPDLKDAGGGGVSDAAEERDSGGSSPEPNTTPEVAQCHFLPRSLSVPVITSAHSQSPSMPSELTEVNDSVTSSHSKVCKENPFDRKPAMSRSKTFQGLSSRRAPAPGHGFPLIKRKVQADQYVSTEDLQVEMGQLDKHLEALEQKGVELERNLRDCKNDKEEEQMLMDWFALIHERHNLVRRDTELVYLTKQQRLEERQADVEYELRCLLNKPESDWSEEDRSQEQQLMGELVSIIEQRNQIISSLDQDRQREREEDELWEVTIKNKDLQKDGLKEIKKSKGKFKSTKVFKMLNHKASSSRESMDKKS